MFSPPEPVVPGHSSVSDRSLPGWTGCWLGHFGPCPWFPAEKHSAAGGRGEAPIPLEDKDRHTGKNTDRVCCGSILDRNAGEITTAITDYINKDIKTYLKTSSLRWTEDMRFPPASILARLPFHSCMRSVKTKW